ncbi:MAG: hypothetical protein OJF49_002542 [Ktedonobacterales bacterium]|jgi:DNA-binding NarL/FixJ family response regulator|nr:MAG: hypothetical protein OJF49_002542 [Ktedonobacterales bacterium]
MDSVEYSAPTPVPLDFTHSIGVPIGEPERSPAHRIRVLALEDHPLYLDGLHALLDADGAFLLVAHADNGSLALALARQYQPDLLLIDIGLPDANGLDLVHQLRRVAPDARIAVLTGHENHDDVIRASRLGVDGFLRKDTPGHEIISSLHAIMRGERIIGDPRALTIVLKEYTQVMRERERDRSGLTLEEVEMLRLAAMGLNNKDIGAHQFWSEITVKRKMQEVYRKLGVKSRAQAVAEAIRLGHI